MYITLEYIFDEFLFDKNLIFISYYIFPLISFLFYFLSLLKYFNKMTKCIKKDCLYEVSDRKSYNYHLKKNVDYLELKYPIKCNFFT